MNHRYGDHPSQFCELTVPTWSTPERGWPAVALLHGGFWKQRWALDLMSDLADDLAMRGVAAWNVEYRRVGGDDGGEAGGGWPQTGNDVTAALDTLAGLDVIDARRIVVVGHSAGGQLALWAGLSGATAFTPAAVVGLGPVADLVAGSAAGVGNGDIERFIGGSVEERPEAFANASPASHLPSRVPQLIVSGRSDEDVPIRHVDDYTDRVRSTDSPLDEISLDGVGHMELIDPTHEAWRNTASWIEMVLRPNIALVGFMGTGKTTVGRRVAERLGYDFVDTDELVERAHGPIPSIFAERGEQAFRTLEAEAVESITGRTGMVIATGGGLVTNLKSARRLEALATVVTLTASPATILERVEADGDTRPLLAGPDPAAAIESLLAQRADAYGRYPSVDAHVDVEAISDRVIELVLPTTTD